jgi:small subunit ribosomal protein S17
MSPQTETESRADRKERVGKVVSAGMDKTIVVAVERRFRHPLYKKYVRKTTKLHAHDKDNTCNVGDTVRIVECRPLSKMKRWRLQAVVERAK